jgi:hypothetical protein
LINLRRGDILVNMIRSADFTHPETRILAYPVRTIAIGSRSGMDPKTANCLSVPVDETEKLDLTLGAARRKAVATMQH